MGSSEELWGRWGCAISAAPRAVSVRPALLPHKPATHSGAIPVPLADLKLHFQDGLYYKLLIMAEIVASETNDKNLNEFSGFLPLG